MGKNLLAVLLVCGCCQPPPAINPAKEQPTIKPALAEKPVRVPAARDGYVGVFVYHAETKIPLQDIAVELRSLDFTQVGNCSKITDKDGVCWFKKCMIRRYPGIVVQVAGYRYGHRVREICNPSEGVISFSVFQIGDW